MHKRQVLFAVLAVIAALIVPAASASAAIGKITVKSQSPQQAQPQTPRSPLAAAHQAGLAARAMFYTVQRGDTLSQIAARHGTGWRHLYALNTPKITNPDLIYPGQRLRLTGTVTAAVASTDHDGDYDNDWSDSPAPAPAHHHHHHYVAPAAVTGGGYTAASGSFEACVIRAESGGNPRAYNPASGASGLYGFLLSTWDSLGLGYSGGAYTAPASVQHQGFEIEYGRAGTSPWAPYDGC